MAQDTKYRFDWRHSIEAKIGAGLLITFCIAVTLIALVSQNALQLARRLAFEKMALQTGHYVENMNQEYEHVKRQQIEFFNDRTLPLLVSGERLLEGYDLRDALLSVKERIYTIVSSSALIESAALYLPDTDYRITQAGIRRLTEQDEADIETYLQYRDQQIHYTDTGFYMVETGEPYARRSERPGSVFVIHFSDEAIRERLKELNAAEDGGVLLLNYEGKCLLECGSDDLRSEEMLERLDLEDGALREEDARVSVDGKSYLVFIGDKSSFGLFLRYIREESVTFQINRFRNLAYALLSGLALLFAVVLVYITRLIHKPVEALVNAFRRVEAGNLAEHLPRDRRDEFDYLYASFNEMEDQMTHMIDEVYVQQNLTQRAELKQLQAQIAPHFLYNSFFALRGKLRWGDHEGAEELAEHLGNYFQYLTRDASDDMSLEQEAAHAQSYAAIQGTRFVNRISIEFAPIPEHFKSLRVPRLTLQPILENAFGHGLKEKAHEGLLIVRYEEDDGEYRVIVEDNGEGTDDKKLAAMGEELISGDVKEITGLVNIHRRLRIYYRGNAGLRLERSALGGVRTTVYIRKGGLPLESKSADRG